MSSEVEVKWSPGAKEKLKNAPDKVLYAVARMFHDTILTSGITPYKSGKMEQSMSSKGIQGVVKDNDGYYIGNYTDYASHVYNLDGNVHWSRQGSSSHWFEKKWAERGDSIISTCIARYKL